MITLEPLVKGKKPEDTTVVVAMSGGVDSSVVAGLLHKLGYKTIGITLQLWDYAPAEGSESKKFGTCCAIDDVYDARRVCQTLGIPHYVLNYESEFKDKVIDDFVETYLAGATPIPCVRCNQRIKFDSFMDKAKALGADVLVTGHYVRKDMVNGKPVIKRGADYAKDQSYYLFTTTPEQLAYADFPLGSLTKDETRELAKELGLHIHSKKDSQDICFVPGGDYRKVVRKFAPQGEEAGNIVTVTGEVVGKHNGIIDFTVGQRKGLGGGFKTPHYVVEIRPATREVVIGEEKDLGKTTFTTKELNWLDEKPVEGRDVLVKVRSLHKGAMATLHDLGEGRVEVVMKSKERQVAPGQAAVFYDENDVLLGGGWIETAPESRLKVKIA